MHACKQAMLLLMAAWILHMPHCTLLSSPQQQLLQ
jgi:hypothetical protein